jgi:hypothetical protein
LCVFVLLATETGQGRATATNPLRFFKNYFVTGDHVVAGVGLKKAGSGGVVTDNIAISGVPSDADPVAAFLYWGTVVFKTNPDSGHIGALFNNAPISDLAVNLTPPGTSPCWSSGGGSGNPDGSKTLIEWRADVFRSFDANNDGVVTAAEVNGSHPITLPGNSSGGNGAPFTQGASVVVIYRSHKEPLRAIVLYDGGFTIDNQTNTVTQNIAGFYQASTTNPQSKLTMIIGDGQDNFSEQVLFGETSPTNLIATNPFISHEGQTWDNPTFTETAAHAALLSGGASSAVVSIDTSPFPSSDCLTGPAMILNTTVQDTDLDGLLDVWEEGPAETDPNGNALPDLAAMGANKNHKDLFLEAAYFVAPANTSYGTGTSQVTDGFGHDHLLSIDAVNMLGNAYKNAPVLNPDTTYGIDLHIDVGGNHQTNPANPYIIPSNLARGGETIIERACTGQGCAFPDWPGTVGWKVGLQFYRDAPEKSNGAEFNPTIPQDVQDEADCRAGVTQCRQRFDRNRKDMFHFLLLAHSIGIRKSENQCIPPAVPTNGVCPTGTDNPDFKIPRSISGMGDFPGGDLLETLGQWGNGFRGSDFVQASTVMHEQGHNFWLTHTGDLFTAPPPFEDNCNSDYLSVMNYLFQIPGLTPDPPPPPPNSTSASAASPAIDYSGQLLPSLNESDLPAGLGQMAYRSAWYAPLSGVHQSLQTTGAKRHCNGTPLSAAEELDRVNGGGWVRIDGTNADTTPAQNAMDWNGDLILNDVHRVQDISFNGTTNTAANLLNGSNDWLFVANLDPANPLRKATGLQQVGSRRNAGGYSLDGKDFGGKDFGGKDFGGKDFGGKDFGGKDFGGKDFGGDQDREQATATPQTLHSLKAEIAGRNVRLTWKAPTAQPDSEGLLTYIMYRVDGNKVTDTTFSKKVTVGQTTDLTILDTRVTAGKTYTWFGVVKYPDGSESNMSHSVSLALPK